MVVVVVAAGVEQDDKVRPICGQGVLIDWISQEATSLPSGLERGRCARVREEVE